MSRPTAPLSPTDCELCTAAERPPQRPLGFAAALAAGVLIGFVRPPRRRAGADLHRAMAVMLTGAYGAPEPSGYEKHRARWVATGDVLELERMLRHPLPAQPEHRHPRPRPGRLYRARCVASILGPAFWAALFALFALFVAGFLVGMMLIGGTG